MFKYITATLIIVTFLLTQCGIGFALRTPELAEQGGNTADAIGVELGAPTYAAATGNLQDILNDILTYSEVKILQTENCVSITKPDDNNIFLRFTNPVDSQDVIEFHLEKSTRPGGESIYSFTRTKSIMPIISPYTPITIQGTLERIYESVKEELIRLETEDEHWNEWLSLVATHQLRHFIPNVNLQNYRTQKFGSGRLNKTFLIRNKTNGEKYIFQYMGKVFNLDEIDKNLKLSSMAQFDAKENGDLPDYWETCDYYDVAGQQTKMYNDGNGGLWRLMRYIDSTTFESLNDIPEEDRADAIKSMGIAMAVQQKIFSYMQNFGQVGTPLKNFHNTLYHIRYLRDVLSGNETVLSLSNDTTRVVRLQEGVLTNPQYEDRIKDLLKLINAEESSIRIIDSQAQELGLLPAHNDTKINNFLFRRINGKLTCVAIIDWDTIQLGRLIDDLGDALRSAVNIAGEEPVNIESVAIDKNVAENIINSYLDEFTKLFGQNMAGQIRPLAYEAARLYFFELGIRFFADFLAGNKYFASISAPDSNLYRAEVQFRALQEWKEIFGGIETSTAAPAAGIPYVKKILVVEQNESVRMAVKELLKASGFANENIITTDVGENTESVLSLIESNKPDFIVAGVNNGRGTELAERLNGRLPLLLMSSNFEPAGDTTRTIASIYSGKNGVHGVIAKEDLNEDTFVPTATNAVDNWLRFQAAKRTAGIITGENEDLARMVEEALKNLGFNTVLTADNADEDLIRTVDLIVDLSTDTQATQTIVKQILGIQNLTNLLSLNNSDLSQIEIEQRIKAWLATQA